MLDTLYTNRLLLRPLTPDDRAALVRLHRDPLVMRFNPSAPTTDAEASARLDGNVFIPWPPGLGFRAIEREGTFLGWIMLIPADGGVEVGYRLHAEAWGNGYATEALMAITAYGAGPLGLNPILAEARADNAASLRVLEKAGYRLLERFEEAGTQWVRYAYGVTPPPDC